MPPTAQEKLGVIIPLRRDRILHMAKWTLAKLRKHQRLFEIQIGMASKKQLPDTVEFLQLAYDECSDAIRLKYFGDYPGMNSSHS